MDTKRSFQDTLRKLIGRTDFVPAKPNAPTQTPDSGSSTSSSNTQLSNKPQMPNSQPQNNNRNQPNQQRQSGHPNHQKGPIRNPHARHNRPHAPVHPVLPGSDSNASQNVNTSTPLNHPKSHPSHPSQRQQGGGKKNTQKDQKSGPKTIFVKRDGFAYPPIKPFEPESVKYPYPNPLQKGAVRVIVLGGCQEIGKNALLIEYGDSMVVIDIGLQFPNEYMQGIDYVIPDMNYVYKNKDKLKAIFVTHGHYDHIGGIPHVMDELPDVPMYATALTAAMVKRKQEDLGKTSKVRVITADETIIAGDFKVEFFGVNHTIPDCIAVVVHTPLGVIVDTGDWKYDPNPIGEKPLDWERVKSIGANNKVLALFADSTSTYVSGHQISESAITPDLEIIFQQSKGRMIVGTFSSLLSRVQQIIWLAKKYNRKIVLEGRSMKINVEIAKQLQKIDYPEGIFIAPPDVKKYQDNEVLILTTGAQGEENAALMRMATKRHKYFEIEKGDSVVFSSSVIPGNENSVQQVMDLIYRHGGKVYHYKQMDIHAGGHAMADEAVMMYRALNPQYYIPKHGHHFMLILHAEKIEEAGLSREKIFVTDNGQPIEFYPDGTAALTKTSAGNKIVAVQGLGVGDIGPIIFEDRKVMGDNGIFVVVLTVSKNGGKLVASPEILSRGFIFMRGQEALIAEARTIAKKAYEANAGLLNNNIQDLKDIIRINIENYLYNQIQRDPMVLPLIVKV